jgi:hypothetical protein
MLKSLARFSLPLLALLAMNGAHAEDCADTSFSGVAASACIGSLPNNINGATAETDFLATTFGGSWSFVGSTDSTGFGPFSSNPSGATSGTLNFDSAVSGRIVIGLKAANQHSFYYFDLAAPVTSLSFDTTAGIATNVRGNAQNLSHAILYAGSPLPVPEPASWALLAAGLGVIGAIARRRV